MFSALGSTALTLDALHELPLSSDGPLSVKMKHFLFHLFTLLVSSVFRAHIESLSSPSFRVLR